MLGIVLVVVINVSGLDTNFSNFYILMLHTIIHLYFNHLAETAKIICHN